jgi:endogenous inhibitor of DNA gyrase (YacG/DUF329 family)
MPDMPDMPDVYDFGGRCAKTSTEQCTECGTTVAVSTQTDYSPEYYTDIYVRCPNCGSSVQFTLLVN